MELFDALLKLMVSAGASDLHLTVGIPPVLRLNGRLQKITEADVEELLEELPAAKDPLNPETLKEIAAYLLREPRHKARYEEKGNADLAWSVPGLSRFRLNVYRQRGSPAVACRVLSGKIPSVEELFPHAPGTAGVIKRLSGLPRGLVLVTGPTGNGKSTTLAAMIDLINTERALHVITLEDPIEYVHMHKKSVINQREIHNDTASFASGLRAALREDPDVILVGEMRDPETIAIAITAAETGHLVFATLHTSDAAQTVDRIIDVFPPHQQPQIRVQLAMTLQGVVSQQLLPRRDGTGRVAAVEVLVATPAVRNLIREGKTHQIISAIQTGGKFGMQTMDAALCDLCRRGAISIEEAASRASDTDSFMRMMHS